MKKQEPEDYLNLGRANKVDEFALGEPEADAGDESASTAPRALFIAPLIIGFVILIGLMIGIFIVRDWDDSPQSEITREPEVKIVKPAAVTEKRAVTVAPTPVPASEPAASLPQPPPSPEPAVKPVSAILPELTPAVGMVLVKTANGLSSGSGFVIRKDGLFVTNYHVIDGAQEIAVKLSNSSKINRAYVDKYDAEKDLALLRFEEAGPFPVLAIEEGTVPELGEEVIVLGYPLGTKLGLDITVSTGIVSSLRNYPEISLIQTNAAINHGNSGGPMIWRRTNRVIGVVSAKARDSESIGFAINVKELKKLMGGF